MEKPKDNPTHFPRFAVLDVLRGLAAVSVMLFHFAGVGNDFGDGSPWKPVLRYGYLGIAVFFVISGFLIPWSLHHARHTLQNTADFLLRRFSRLYPAYAATCVLVIILWYGSSLTPWFRGNPPGIGVSQVLSHATLTCDFVGENWWNPVFWTLAIEVQYYVAIALTFPLLVSSQLTLRLCALAAWICVPVIFPDGPFLFRFCALFSLGTIVFMKEKGLLAPWIAFICLVAAAGVQAFFQDLLTAAAGLATALLIKYPPNLSPKPLVWVGTIAYSLFLLHVPIGGRIINLFDRLPQDLAFKVLGLITAVGISLGAAYVFFVLVERPTHAWSRKWGRKSRVLDHP